MTLQTEARLRRLIPRYPLAHEVQVRSAGQTSRSYPARDVSQGGLFLATQDSFELFSEVVLEVMLPRGRSTVWTARVVHILSPDKAQSFGVPAGIGVQFEGLTQQQLAEVHELVKWAREHDPRPRIARRRPDASLDALQGEPMLTYVLQHIDGKRDPEALAQELGLELGSVERMLRELGRLGVIELLSAGGQATAPSAATPEPPPTAASVNTLRARPERLDPQLASQLTALERRLSQDSFYGLLDIPEDASSDAVRAGYRAQAGSLRASNIPQAQAARVERLHNHLREACGVLSSPHKRKEYDEYLERGRKLAAAEALRAGRSLPTAAVLRDQQAPQGHAQPQPASKRPNAMARARFSGAQLGQEPQPMGAAAQLLAQAEQAHAAGEMEQASKHLQLLTAMSFDDAKIRARVAQLRTSVARALAVDFEKQAAYEEKQQRWAQAARSWLRVAEGRPKDSVPLQRAALAQLQAGVDLRKVMELAKRAVALADADPQARRTLARVYVAADMRANARRELEAAQRCNAVPQPSAAGATQPSQRKGLFKRLLGRDAPN